MAKQIQLRRGTTAEHTTFTGAVGEITVDTTKDTVVVHDGSTVGGFALAKASDLTGLITLSSLSAGTGIVYSSGVISADTNTMATKSYVTTSINDAIALKDNTDEITEGSTNLYFTNARARSAISVTDSGGDGSLSYNASNGVITYTGPTASDYRLAFTAGSGITITDGTISTDSTMASKSYVDNSITTAIATKDNTDEITEGSTNLYFTTARARGSISVTDNGGDGSLSYNSTSGILSYTGPSATEVRAHFTAGTGITITNGSIAADTSTMATRTYVDNAILTKDNTDEITEGSTNLYFTNTRARSALSVTSGSGAYNSTTGVFTIPTNTSELTNGAGFITSSSNITGSAAKWTTARTITLSGDLSGSVSIDGSANATLTATIAADSVALGTDTTGNYMAGVTAGTGVSVTGTAGEGWNPTIAIGQAVSTTDNVTFNNLTLNGNLTVNGTTTTVNTQDMQVTDPLIYIGTGNTGNSVDIGLVGHFNDGLYQHTGIVRRAATDKWHLFSGMTTEPGATITVTDGTYVVDTLVANLEGNVTGNVTGSVSGNAGTATTLQTARTISLSGDASGSVSFNGSANADISVTVADNSHAHTIANVTGLQTALDGKQNKSNQDSRVNVSGTQTLNIEAYDTFYMLMNGNVTVALTGVLLQAPASLTIITKQDGSGGRTVTWPAAFKFAGGIVPPITTTANAVDVWSCFTYDGGSTYVVSLAVKDAK